jgi:hypothetical protein
MFTYWTSNNDTDHTPTTPADGVIERLLISIEGWYASSLPKLPGGNHAWTYQAREQPLTTSPKVSHKIFP